MKNTLIFAKVLSLVSFLAYGGTAVAYQLPSPKSPVTCPPPIPVTLSSPDYVFETSFMGLAMQPFANNLDYAAEALPFNYGDTEPAVSPSWVIPAISTRFHFGFVVGVAGIFKEAHSSLMLNWERYHTSSDSSSLIAASVNDMVGTFFEIGPAASPYKMGRGTVKFHLDEVSLDYGTFVQFGDLLRMNLFSGVSFSRIHQYRLTTLSDFPGTIVRTLNVPSEFMGAGPELGLQFYYQIIQGFQLVGNGRATLFVGTFENSTTFTTTSPDLTTLGDQNPNIQTTSVYNKNGIVPGLEGKLGLAYEYSFNCHSMFKIEAGYQAQIYLNSIRSIDMGSEVTLGPVGAVGTSTTGVYARTFDRMVSDFAIAGPYGAIHFAF